MIPCIFYYLFLVLSLVVLLSFSGCLGIDYIHVDILMSKLTFLTSIHKLDWSLVAFSVAVTMLIFLLEFSIFFANSTFMVGLGQISKF